MSKREQIIREILFDPEIKSKYNISEEDITGVHRKKIVDVIETIVNENDNGRTARQIYPVLKNIHKI